MSQVLRISLLVVLFAAAGAGLQAATKVQVCHLPPGSTDNYHTISVPETRLAIHLAHGDLAGNCNLSCDTLCDDGDACTQDHDGNCEDNGCLAMPEPVDCDDGQVCTTDTCDPEAGCQYAPIVCDDGDLCTIDVCNPTDGQCIFPDKDCGSLGVCAPDTGACDYPCDGITCQPMDQCHAAGTCVLPGTCTEGAALADGTPCDDGDSATANDQCSQGACSGTPVVCPCDFSTGNLNTLFDGAPGPTCVDLTITDEALVLYDGGGSNNAVFPLAIVEYVPAFNIPLEVVRPECGAVDFAVIDAAQYKNGISEAEADACVADLQAYINLRGLVCE